MKKWISIYLLLSIVFLISCGSENNEKKNDGSLSGTITISGAFALYPMVIKWKEEYCKIYPDVQIDISAGGAGKGIADALSGLVDIGMVSREISQSETDKGAWYVPVAKDAVVGVMNSNNPVINEIKQKGMSFSTLSKIFITGEIKTWGEAIGDPAKSNELIKVYTRSDACGAADVWAKLFGKKQEDLNGIGVFGDPGIAQAVQKDKFGIGYNNIAFAYNHKTKKPNDGLFVIPLDIKNKGIIDQENKFYDNFDALLKAISVGAYPSPPVRNLYLVTNKKPVNSLVKHFLNWILTDGQKYILVSGYIQLEDQYLKAALDKLK
jgi:phosphate transport system substrate-binding protein